MQNKNVVHLWSLVPI